MKIKVAAFEEGYETAPYYCSEGYPTIGNGKKIGPKGSPLNNYQFVMPLSVAEEWLRVDLEGLSDKLNSLNWFKKQSEDRKAILVSMAYQVGLTGLLKFKNMIAALDDCNYTLAASEAIDSRWAKQTPARAERHALVLKTGNIMDAYEGLIDV